MKPSQMRHSIRGSRTNRLLQWVGLLAFILILSACATAKKKFVGTTEANVGIFADTTLALLSDPELGVTKGGPIYTKEFFNPDEEEEKRLEDAIQRAERVANAMVEYSFTIVTFVESEPEEEGRIRLYTEYLSSFDDKVLRALGLDSDYYEAIIEDVRDQKKFIDALKTAQPILNGLGRYMELTQQDIIQAVNALAVKIDKKIDTKYSDVITYQESLEAEKYEILLTIAQLYLAAKGDKAAYKRALARGTILNKALIPKGSSPSYEELKKIVIHLMERLENMDRIWKEIEPDWIAYRETHRELDRLVAEAKKEIDETRITTLVWVRAHQKMAAGIFSPAEWFTARDIAELGVKAAL
jgi:hypothetical protein